MKIHPYVTVAAPSSITNAHLHQAFYLCFFFSFLIALCVVNTTKQQGLKKPKNKNKIKGVKKLNYNVCVVCVIILIISFLILFIFIIIRR